MFKFREQQRFALEVGDRFFMLGIVDVRLDHFLDGAGRFAKVAILCQINGAHAAAADPAHDFITAVQYFSTRERLRLWSLVRDGIGAGSLL